MRERLSAQAALVWLLLALVLVPALGRLHQVVHGTALDRIHAGSVALADAPAAREAGHGLLDVLVPNHTAADCQLLDQLALGHAVPAACVALPPLAPAQVPPTHHADATGAWPVVQLRARGPPVT